ncbi:hypothetical protein HK100_011425 [Physocladia obscura]|uniref:Uncharacterized protein n=1 Tax=Physocladia obscura TaxID=109957 RepID=A0AAD5T2Z3_9FUNG|nr:hypothetical protein HK100_011425 [Physocladia obscura]
MNASDILKDDKRSSRTSTSDLANSQHKSAGNLHRSLKGSLGSLHALDRRAMLGNGSNGSVLSEWNYVLGQPASSSGAPSVIERASMSGYSYATKKTGRGNNVFREPTFQGIFRPKFIKRETSEVYCVKFSPDDEYLAAGLGSSAVQIYSTTSNEMVRTLEPPPETGQDLFPCTTVTFRPDLKTFRNKNILVAGFADGRIIHWHYTSGQLISSISEPSVQINCVAYQNIGLSNDQPAGICNYFASAASDSFVRIYDAQTHAKILEMNRGQGTDAAGHSSRVFSVKFHPSDTNMLISGGWDNTIQFWDIRVGHSVRAIYGPHICGTDALDISPDGSLILAASFAKSDQLQTYDYATGRLVDTLAWSVMDGERRCSLLYSGSFGRRAAGSNGGGVVVAGGCGAFNEVKMFSLATGRAVGVAHGFTHSVYSVALSNNERMVAVGGAFKSVYGYDIDQHAQTTDIVY